MPECAKIGGGKEGPAAASPVSAARCRLVPGPFESVRGSSAPDSRGIATGDNGGSVDVVAPEGRGSAMPDMRSHRVTLDG